MSLSLVAIPLGHPQDITLRALECLRTCDGVIGEERREASTFLKKMQIDKPLELLNEHSTPQEVAKLGDLCRDREMVLISDCGTPGFCDPGAELIRLCRSQKIPVRSLPGPSSLMLLLSLSSQRLNQFVFYGFLPAAQELRQAELKDLVHEPRAMVLMDTPYRLSRLVTELAQVLPQRRALLTLDLTAPTEKILEGSLNELATSVAETKAEFMLLLYPDPSLKSLRRRASPRSNPVRTRPAPGRSQLRPSRKNFPRR
jgi:16S rRNA (cytidine1402-2'-O)-methyltransferase